MQSDEDKDSDDDDDEGGDPPLVLYKHEALPPGTNGEQTYLAVVVASHSPIHGFKIRNGDAPFEFPPGVVISALHAYAATREIADRDAVGNLNVAMAVTTIMATHPVRHAVLSAWRFVPIRGASLGVPSDARSFARGVFGPLDSLAVRVSTAEESNGVMQEAMDVDADGGHSVVVATWLADDPWRTAYSGRVFGEKRIWMDAGETGCFPPEEPSGADDQTRPDAQDRYNEHFANETTPIVVGI